MSLIRRRTAKDKPEKQNGPKPKTERGNNRSRIRAKLKFTPPTTREISKVQAQIKVLNQDEGILKKIVEGQSYEQIAAHLGVSVRDAFTECRKIIKKYAEDVALTALEAKALDLQRYDAMLQILWKEFEPGFMRDPDGKIMFDGETGLPLIKHTHLGAARMIMDILNARARIYGYEAGEKMKAHVDTETIRREYVNVDIGTL